MQSLFFDSTEADPREYHSGQFSDYFNTFIRSGVFGASADSLLVTPGQGFEVRIAPGRVFIEGRMGISEAGERLTLPGEGKHSIALRLDYSPEQRRIYPVVLEGSTSFPAPVREGSLHDLVIAHAQAGPGGAVTVEDTRGDYDICGFAAFMGQPAYQPPRDIPALVWDYTLFPDLLTRQQREMVESSPFYMAQFEASRIGPVFRAFTEPGEYRFTVPASGRYMVEVVSGGAVSDYGGNGGGYAKKLVTLHKGEEITVTVGAAQRGREDAAQASSFGDLVSASGPTYWSPGAGVGGDINITGGTGNSTFSVTPGGSFMCAPGNMPNGFGRGGFIADDGRITKAATGGCVIVRK